MAKILHTAKYTGLPLNILKSVVPQGFEVETLNELNRESLISQARDAEYLLVSGRLKIDDEVLCKASNLKMIQRTGVGTDMLDLDAIKRRNIPVYINRGINARSVAEHTIALMLSCLKNIPKISKDVKNGIWKKQESGLQCNELYGKRVGLVGLGEIGRLVAKYLNVFGAEVYYTDIIRSNKDLEIQYNLHFTSSFEELLPQIDILSFHCPLTETNKEILDKDRISLMKDGTIIVNTARGKLINEEDLYQALKMGKIKSAALDVHYNEPINKDNPLIDLDNVILTPHIGGLAQEAFSEMLTKAVENIKRFDEGDVSQLISNRLI